MSGASGGPNQQMREKRLSGKPPSSSTNIRQRVDAPPNANPTGYGGGLFRGISQYSPKNNSGGPRVGGSAQQPSPHLAYFRNKTRDEFSAQQAAQQQQQQLTATKPSRQSFPDSGFGARASAREELQFTQRSRGHVRESEVVAVGGLGARGGYASPASSVSGHGAGDSVDSHAAFSGNMYGSTRTESQKSQASSMGSVQAPSHSDSVLAPSPLREVCTREIAI